MPTERLIEARTRGLRSRRRAGRSPPVSPSRVGRVAARPGSESPAPDIGAAPVPQVQSQPLAGPTVGEALGAGPVRVGLILPLTQNGGPSAVGVSLRNAAQLAIEESGIERHHADDRRRPRHAGGRRAGRAGGDRRRRASSSSGRCSPPKCAKSGASPRRRDGRSSPSRPTRASLRPASICCRS